MLSLGLGFLGLYLVNREALLNVDNYRLEAWSLPLLIFCIGCFFILWIVPAFRLQYLARLQGYFLNWRQALLAHITMVLGSAITPSGSGGGPALIGALKQFNIPMGKGLGIAVQLFILDLVFLVLVLPLGLLKILLSKKLVLTPQLLFFALLACLLSIIGLIILSRYPRLVVSFIIWLRKRPFFKRFQGRLWRIAKDYYQSSKIFSKLPLQSWFNLQVITIISWVANFWLFWGLMRLYDLRLGIFDITSLLSVITLISFTVPTPGASGFMEFAVGVLTSTQIGHQALAAPILFWRMGTFYLIYLLGPLSGWLLIKRKVQKL